MEPSPLPSFNFPAPVEWNRTRYEQVEKRQAAMEAVLKELGYEGILLLAPENLCWFSAGGDPREQGSYEIPQAALYVGSGRRVVLCADDLAPGLFSAELGSLGFQLKQRSTQHTLEDLFDEVCRGRRVCSDTGFGRTRSIAPRLEELRQRSCSFARRTVQELAAATTLCTEQAIGEFTRGGTAGELAGLIARCLTTRGMQPIQIAVSADDDAVRGLMRSAANTRIERKLSVRVVSRHAGMHFVMLRSLRFEELSEAETQGYELLQRQLAEIVVQMNAGSCWQETFTDIEPLARELESSQSWPWSVTGWQVGYRQPERYFSHDAPAPEFATPGTLCYWETRLGPVRCGVMHVVGKNHLFQETSVWPALQVETTMNETLPIPSFLGRVQTSLAQS